MDLKAVLSVFITAGFVGALAPTPAAAQQPNTFTVYASGLQAPRGLRFGPDGNLYVAEAGTGGPNKTGSSCQQVPAPVGPYAGGKTARISKITSKGTRTTVASGFPSTVDAMGDYIGVADVAFIGDTLYALVAGGGCSHGNPDSPTGVARVNRSTGQWTLIADIGDYLKSHPAKYESADDFEPDGTLYSMIAVDGVLYTIEPNHGQMFSVSRRGAINQIIDISASEGHIVPTSVAEQHGTFYVGNLNLFPIDPQWARILTISTGGDYYDLAPGFDINGGAYHILASKAGFTTVVAVDFGPDGLLYALELSAAAGNPTPGAGKVVRVKRSGEIEDVITKLSVPTGMTFGPDGRLYISNLGAAPPGAGQILRFDITPGW
ncbi:MAG TPA: ScyD/ScyE family protein [Bryobacteraceae bacterium]|nr:ScyD/ScyE family protein [Bryobacteraceae bacterium]